MSHRYLLNRIKKRYNIVVCIINLINTRLIKILFTGQRSLSQDIEIAVTSLRNKEPTLGQPNHACRPITKQLEGPPLNLQHEVESLVIAN